MSKARDLANAGTALGAVDATELGYLDGVTSAVQTQVDAKTAKSTLTTTGDIYYASGANTPARLGIGSTAQVLTVASGIPSWATPAVPVTGANWSLLNSGGTALTGATTITVSGISGKDKIMILIAGGSAAAQSIITTRLNADSGSNYGYQGLGMEIQETYLDSNFFTKSETAADSFRFCTQANNTNSTFSGYILISGCNSSGVKIMNQVGAVSRGTGRDAQYNLIGGNYNGTSTISSVSILSSSGNFDAGTIYVYTSA
jgi:hypothetical protein